MTPKHRRNHSGGSPIPHNSSTAVHDDDHDDGGSARLERFVEGSKCAASCAFEVVLIIAVCTCLKIKGIIGIETKWK